MSIEHCIGQLVDVIYVDSKGVFSKRRIAIYSIRDGRARVLDVNKRAFRTLAVDRILAAVPVRGRPVARPYRRAAGD